MLNILDINAMSPRAVFLASSAAGLLIGSAAGASFNAPTPTVASADASVGATIKIRPHPLQTLRNQTMGATPVSVSTQGDLHRLPITISQDEDLAPPAGAVTPPNANADVLSRFDVLVHCATIDLGVVLRAERFANLLNAPAFDDLDAFYGAHDFSLKAAAKGAQTPPLFLTKLPRELAIGRDIPRRKRLFISMMLPHVIAANAEIKADRKRLLGLIARLDPVAGPNLQEDAWLVAKFADYRVKDASIDRLLARMDIIPPALVIAQAAKESGWGGSRFAQSGNALFGQWTWNPAHKGMVPKERPKGKTYRVRAFDSVLEATRAYMLNLNANRAYGGLRKRRLQRRKAGKAITGIALTEKLEGYSAIGKRYVRALKSLIRDNDLTALNAARLGGSVRPSESPASASIPVQQAVLAKN